MLTRGWCDKALQFHYTAPGFFEKSSPLSTQKTKLVQRIIALLRGRVANSLDTLFPGLQTEIRMALENRLQFPDNGWHAVHAFGLAEQVIARAMGKLLLGAPLCRDQKWLDNAIAYGPRVAISSQIIGFVPTAFKPLVARLLGINAQFDISRSLVVPLIRQRLETASSVKENDLHNMNILQWLLDALSEHGTLGTEKLNELADSLFLVSLPGIHTTVQVLTSTLYQLAAHPKDAEIIRAEIDDVIAEEGSWTKHALDRMWVLDSFIRETNRLYPPGAASLTRKTVAPFDFSDGTTLTSGTYVSAAGGFVVADEAIYEDASTFDAQRFSRLRRLQGDAARWISTSPQYLMFGDGKNACPGRFFAADVIKSTLVQALVGYELRMGADGKRPPPFRMATMQLPDMKANIYLRRRDKRSGLETEFEVHI